MVEKLKEIEERFREVEKMAADPELVKDQQKFKETMQEHSHLSEIMEVYGQYKRTNNELDDAKQLIEEEKDPELRSLAKEELHELEEQKTKLEKKLQVLLVPKDPMDQKNIIMEIRAGTGGDEAALFAADLYRMYSRFAELKGWKIEILSSSDTGIGGFKEVIFSISGNGVYGSLRYESGGHRVQRVPETESGGRIHTSAVTVAVLPEAEATDVQVNPEDLKIDVYRSSGPGGQSVNTTDSAVRITHLPSGLVVTCQDEKSQHKNKAKALRVLRARLFEMEEMKKQQERAEARRSQIGTGDRSERIRTYNFPQNRITDHRINLTLYKLENVLSGELDEVIEPLKISAHEEKLKSGA
ncbi:MAG: peptide chain release factor 1 [Spirochaetia bacterium]